MVDLFIEIRIYKTNNFTKKKKLAIFKYDPFIRKRIILKFTMIFLYNFYLSY